MISIIGWKKFLTMHFTPVQLFFNQLFSKYLSIDENIFFLQKKNILRYRNRTLKIFNFQNSFFFNETKHA